MASWTGTPCHVRRFRHASVLPSLIATGVLSCGHSLSNRHQCHHDWMPSSTILFRASIAVSCGYQRLRLSVCAVHRLVVRWFHWTHPTWRFHLAFSALDEFHATVKWQTGNIINRNEYHEWFQCALPMPRNNAVLPMPPLSSMMNTWTFCVGATDSNNAISKRLFIIIILNRMHPAQAWCAYQ